MVEQRSAFGRRGDEQEQEWREVLAEQAQGGRSVTRFCRERGIAPSSFYFWRGELARREAERRAVGQAATVKSRVSGN